MVQRSEYPDRYNEAEGIARGLIDRARQLAGGGGGGGGGDGGGACAQYYNVVGGEYIFLSSLPFPFESGTGNAD